jgi:DNA-binding CsgD family transcriptional regulator
VHDPESGELQCIRVVPLAGDDRATVAVFVEPLASRRGLADAVERFKLSPREFEVLCHLVNGASTTLIAERLFIAETTVQDTVGRIAAKMHVRKRTEIVARVLGIGREDTVAVGSPEKSVEN